MGLDDGPPQECFIYALADPRTGLCRYIGQTYKGMIRPYQHWSSKRASNELVQAWVAELKSLKLEYTIHVLERVANWTLLAEAEKRWINYAQEHGCELLNIVHVKKPRSLRPLRPKQQTPSTPPLNQQLRSNVTRSTRVSWAEAVRRRLQNTG